MTTTDPAIALSVTYRPLDSIKPYARNARTHTVAQISAIKRSLTEFGWTAPMMGAEDELIAGHARHRSASELNAEGIAIPGCPAGQGPWIDLSHLPPDKRRAYVLADNRLAELASWDMELVRGELLDLATAGFDTTLTGYSMPEISSILQGWQPDFGKIETIQAEATDKLAVILIRCTRPQLEAVEAAVRQAVAPFEGVSVHGH